MYLDEKYKYHSPNRELYTHCNVIITLARRMATGSDSECHVISSRRAYYYQDELCVHGPPAMELIVGLCLLLAKF